MPGCRSVSDSTTAWEEIQGQKPTGSRSYGRKIRLAAAKRAAVDGGSRRGTGDGSTGGAAGLSYAQISPFSVSPTLSPPSVSFYPGASLVQCKKARFVLGRRGGGVRGRIKGFSRSARRNLMLLHAKIDQSQALPLFVTLTYPAEFPHEASTWKRDLDTFAKRFRRRFPAGCFVWKLEPQKRGAPHFHLEVWGVGYVDALKWVGKAWYQVVRSGDLLHLYAGTSVQQVRSWRGVSSYVSKYMAKVQADDQEFWEYPGRWWGIVGRDNLVLAVAVVATMSQLQLHRLSRALRRYVRSCGGRAAPWLSSFFVGSPGTWLERLDGLVGSQFLPLAVSPSGCNHYLLQ